jgi:hypothetical protein
VAAPLILARTFKDAHRYAQDVLGLRIGYYRVVNDSGTIKAVRGTEIHLVPGWDKRPDRFKMKGAMRYCRNRIIDVAAQQAAPADPRGDLTERKLEVAYRYNRILSQAGGEHQIVAQSASNTLETEEDRETPKLDALMSETLMGETNFFDEPYLNEEGSITTGPIPTVVSPEAEALAAKKPGRRRSKCKTCGNLHYKDDPCPEAD